MSVTLRHLTGLLNRGLHPSVEQQQQQDAIIHLRSIHFGKTGYVAVIDLNRRVVLYSGSWRWGAQQ